MRGGVDLAGLMGENRIKYETKWGGAQGAEKVEGVENVEEKREACSSFAGSAWERDAGQAPPAVKQIECTPSSKSRQSLKASAFPGGAWERESRNPHLSLCMIVRDN